MTIIPASTINASDILLDLAKQYWWLIALIFLLKTWKLLWSNPVFKGWFGEKQAQVFSLNKLDPAHYSTLNDLYLPRPDGKGTTQLDHVVLSRYGIFVIETKNYDNWIFGGEKQRQWTQKIYKKSYKFQNPLHQNSLHINALAAFLGLEKEKFHNVVYFIGNTTFKTQMPSNVLNRGLRGYIEGFQQELLTSSQVNALHQTLLDHDQGMNKKLVAKEHVRQLRSA